MKNFIFLLSLVCISIYSQYTTFRIFPSNNIQIEPSIVKSPQDHQILFASALTVIGSTPPTEGVYISTNGGINWSGMDVLPNISSDAGDPGPIIDKNGVFILTYQRNPPTGMFARISTNMGANWSNFITIATQTIEKGSPSTDDISSSPYYGRTYLAWTKFQNPFPVVFSYTNNSGTNWISPTQINNTYNGNVSSGPIMSVGPGGEVYVSWASTLAVNPFNEVKIGFAKSTNGGSNWIVSEAAYDCNGIKSPSLSPWGIRVNGYPLMDVDKTGGARNGWIYIVTDEKNLAPAGTDPDVVMHRSTDGGQTWSAGKRVNQDALNNGKVQLFPIINVDENGGLNVVYYDNRNSVINDSLIDVYLSRSTDGGNNWADYKVSNHRFKPRPATGSGGSGNMGDNIGLTSGNGNLYPVWMDNFSGVFQIWSAIINYSTIGINKIGNEIPGDYKLSQNFPNPFNPATKITFDIPSPAANVRLAVYDISGKEIAVIVNQQLGPGSYEVSFNASSLASGLYIYMLVSGNFTSAKKMLLIK